MQRSLSVSAASWEPCRQLQWVICLKDKKKKHLPISSCAPLFESCHQNISSAILPGFHLISGAGENPRQKARRHSILKASAGTKSIKTHKKLCIQQRLTSEDWEGTMRGGIFDVPFVLNHSSPCIQVSKGILDQWINGQKHRQQRAQIKFRKRQDMLCLYWLWVSRNREACGREAGVEIRKLGGARSLARESWLYPTDDEKLLEDLKVSVLEWLLTNVEVWLEGSKTKVRKAILISNDFVVAQWLNRVQFFVTQKTIRYQASLSTISQSLLKVTSIESVMSSNHFILCHPLLLLPAFFPSIRVLSNELALCIRWPDYWGFSFSISLCNEHSGLISFRIDWFDLFAVQGILKSLLQHHSSKASFFWHSAFFVVQLSHPYMTAGKIRALTMWTFVSRVMSLFFNTLSRFVKAFLPRSKCLLILWL